MSVKCFGSSRGSCIPVSERWGEPVCSGWARLSTPVHLGAAASITPPNAAVSFACFDKTISLQDCTLKVCGRSEINTGGIMRNEFPTSQRVLKLTDVQSVASLWTLVGAKGKIVNAANEAKTTPGANAKKFSIRLLLRFHPICPDCRILKVKLDPF